MLEGGSARQYPWVNKADLSSERSHTPGSLGWGICVAKVVCVPPFRRVATWSTGVFCFLLNARLFLDLNDQLLVWRWPRPKGPAKKKWSVIRPREAGSTDAAPAVGTAGKASSQPGSL